MNTREHINKGGGASFPSIPAGGYLEEPVGWGIVIVSLGSIVRRAWVGRASI